MKITLAVFDLDGTLLTSQSEISERNLKAIKLANKLGIKIIIASGRRLNSIIPLIRPFGFECPIIAYSGSWIVEGFNKKPLIAHKAPWQATSDLIKNIKNQVDMIGLYIDDTLYLDNENEYTTRYENKVNLKAKLVPDLAFFLDLEKINPTRVLIISNRTNNLDKLYSQVKVDYKGKLDFVKSWPTFLEAGKVGVTKGSSLAFWAKLRSVDLTSAVAFGDQENDIPSFQVCGISVAMGNAPPEVKNEATMIAPTNDQDGVAVVLERLLECA